MNAPLPPMPNDLGPAEVIQHPSGDPDLVMGNVAWVVAMTREDGTLKSETVFRAFVTAWNRIKHLPGKPQQLQSMALEEALASINVRCDWRDYSDGRNGEPLRAN